MNNELTLYDYWRILNRRKWVIFFAFTGTLLSTAFYTRFQPISYKAQAMIKIQAPASYAKMPGMDQASYDPWGMIATEIRVIQSADVAERAAKLMGWEGPESSPEEASKAVSKITQMYKAERVQDSNLINISAGAADPIIVADVVNAVVEAYSDYDLEERSRQAKKNLEDISARKNEVEESLRSVERAKQNFLEHNPGTGLGGILASQLMDLETRRREMLKNYTSNHPEVIKIDQQLQQVQLKLGELPARETELVRLSRELRLNEDIYTTLNRQYEEAKIALSAVVSFVSVVNRAVPPDAPASSGKTVNFVIGSLLGLFLGIVIAFFIENLDVSISTIEDIEKLTELPVLGIIPHMPSMHTMDNFLTQFMRKQRYGIEAFRNVLVFHQPLKSPLIEAYHSLRANMLSKLGTKSSVAVLFSSSGAAEGKTITSVNFCIAAAHAGFKTLLVDTDMRRPSLFKVFGIEREPGLTDIIGGQVNWRDTVHSTADFLMGELNLDQLLNFPGIDNFKLITSGTGSINVVDALDSDMWAGLIQEWKKEFDLIVFDSTPVLLFIDPVIVAQHTDGVVLVYKSGKMARTALKRAKEQIVSGKARMLGVVLNDMKSTEMGPSYGYYYDYGHYARPEKLNDF